MNCEKKIVKGKAHEIRVTNVVWHWDFEIPHFYTLAKDGWDPYMRLGRID